MTETPEITAQPRDTGTAQLQDTVQPDAVHPQNKVADALAAELPSAQSARGVSEYATRALAHAELLHAEKALASGELLLGPTASSAAGDPAAASLLFQEGLYWVTQALHHGSSLGEPTASEDTLNDVWAALESGGVLRGVLSTTQQGELKTLLAERSWQDLRGLPEAKVLKAARLLRDTLDTSIRKLRERQAESQGAKPSFIARWGFPGSLVVVAVAFFLLAFATNKPATQEESANLALGKRVTASSAYHQHPGTEGLVNGITMGIGVHTDVEDRPWVQIDLGSAVQVQEIEVWNSDHCCQERATPLLIQTSTDGKKYDLLARREGTFLTWKVQLPPRQARFVKLSLDRRDYLHLSEVIVR